MDQLQDNATRFIFQCQSLTINILYDPFRFSVSALHCFKSVAVPPCRRSRSQSCPFFRVSLKRVNSADLWIYTDNRDIVDCSTIEPEATAVIPASVFEEYGSHVKRACARCGRARCVPCGRLCSSEERDPPPPTQAEPAASTAAAAATARVR